MAILGGMGRTRNGSCAELVTVPTTNVVAVRTSLDWADLAAVPEVYATAWSGLFGNLDLQPRETVLVRGATSSLGQAALNLAVDHGATVLAATRDAQRAPLPADPQLIRTVWGAGYRFEAAPDPNRRAGAAADAPTEAGHA